MYLRHVSPDCANVCICEVATLCMLRLFGLCFRAAFARGLVIGVIGGVKRSQGDIGKRSNAKHGTAGYMLVALRAFL